MTQFFFHLHLCGEVILDPEGSDFEDSVAAIKHASKEARTLLAAEIEREQLCLGCHIEVVNSETRESADVPFRPAVEIASF